MTTVADGPVLVTIPNIELCSVGVWVASTGEIELTAADLRAAVAAIDDPAIHAPRLRIGHTPHGTDAEMSAGGFTEQPAFGRFENLRLDSTGTTIYADAVGVPAWLAEILPSAYPSRSIEGYRMVTAAGRTHELVITSVAMLGVSMPAVETLEDLRLAYGAEMPEGVQYVGERVAATRGEPMPVKASVAVEDVRSSFYSDFATSENGRYWWWLNHLFVTPSVAVADDDEGALWACPYTIDGDTVTWGEPAEVRIQFVNVATGKVAAAAATQLLTSADSRVAASAADGRPKDRIRAATTNKKEPSMDGEKIRELLNLPAEATDEQVEEKMNENEQALMAAAGLASENETLKKQARMSAQAGAVVLDEATVAEMKANAAAGAEALKAQVLQRQTAVVDQAIKAGKLMPARRDHYLALMSKDEQGTTEFIGQLEPGTIPVIERGVNPDQNLNGDGGRVPLSAVAASFGIKRDLTATGKGI